MSNQKKIRLTNTLNLLEEDPLADLSECALDAILDDGLFKDLPIISTFLGIVKTTRNIADRIYLEKILLFLNALDDVPIQKYNAMLNNLENPDERRKIGKRLMLLLNAATEMEKPEYLARAFQAFIVNKIDRETLNQFWHIIDKSLTSDLEAFLVLDFSTMQAQKHQISLWLSVGLFYYDQLHFKPIIGIDGKTKPTKNSLLEPRLTDLGKKFYEVMGEKG